MITIIVVDDHQLVRQGIYSLLEKEEFLKVVAEAKNGSEAIEQVKKHKPDIVLLDIEMPGMNGIEVASEIIGIHPQTKILALSRHDERRFVSEMFAAGASGYIIKDSAIEELLMAINTVIANRMYCSPTLVGKVVEDYSRLLNERKKASVQCLTPREREVLQLIIEGNITKKIASKLNLSVRTVDTHRQQIMNKLNVHNIVDLTKFGIREGLIKV